MLTTSSQYWWAVYTQPCHEKRAAQLLEAAGEEVFVATRKEVHQWSDRKKEVEVILIPHVIFLRSTEQHRIDLIKSTPRLVGVMQEAVSHRPITIPDNQMHTFMTAVQTSNDEVKFVSMDDPQYSAVEFKAGDEITIMHGKYRGAQGYIVNEKAGDRFVVRVGSLGLLILSCADMDLLKPDDNCEESPTA